MAWNNFKSLEFILSDKYWQLVTKKSPGILLIPRPLYGDQTWSLRRRKKDTSQLSAEEGKENRYRLTDAEVRQRTKTKDIVEVARSVKWKWRAHVAGIDQRGWAHVSSTWCLRTGKRRTVRPKTWRADTSKSAAGGQYSRRAKNWNEWSTLKQHP